MYVTFAVNIRPLGMHSKQGRTTIESHVRVVIISHFTA